MSDIFVSSRILWRLCIGLTYGWFIVISVCMSGDIGHDMCCYEGV